jgi:hypothetical protein
MDRVKVGQSAAVARVGCAEAMNECAKYLAGKEDLAGLASGSFGLLKLVAGLNWADGAGIDVLLWVPLVWFVVIAMVLGINLPACIWLRKKMWQPSVAVVGGSGFRR